jgi:hypothetical protein
MNTENIALRAAEAMRDEAAKVAAGDSAQLRQQGHPHTAEAYEYAAKRIRAIDADKLVSSLTRREPAPEETEAFEAAATGAQFNVARRDNGELFHPIAQRVHQVWRAGVRWGREQGGAATRPSVDLSGLTRHKGSSIATTHWKEQEDFFLADDVQSLLSTLPAHQAVAAEGVKVPDGWKLVPVASTAEMDSAGKQVITDGTTIEAECCWNAMLAAAPVPPVSAAEQPGDEQAEKCKLRLCCRADAHTPDCTTYDPNRYPVDNAAHLARHAQAGAVPKGYWLAPIQLTDEMRDAGNEIILDRGKLVAVWATMRQVAREASFAAPTSTDASAQAAQADVRDAALEEAAIACLCAVKNRRPVYAKDCVELIRALKRPADDSQPAVGGAG